MASLGTYVYGNAPGQWIAAPNPSYHGTWSTNTVTGTATTVTASLLYQQALAQANYQDYVVPQMLQGVAPAKKKADPDSALSWLDKRVNELRVKL